MDEISSKLIDLELKVLQLLKLNSELIKKNHHLEEVLAKTEQKNIQTEKEHKELENQNRRLRVVNAISGNGEYKKVMKLQMNRLIKEIDFCISELKNN